VILAGSLRGSLLVQLRIALSVSHLCLRSG
jgi:hypothetical protein